MNIGEFFVNLGVKGSEKAIGALDNMKKTFGELGSTSLETKAAIVGAMYALERTFSNSSAAGTNLRNFNTLLGVSAKTLQQYQYAARQMGVTNEDVEGSFRGIQAAMSKTLMGEGAPKGMARVATLTGGISPQDMVKYQQNPEELMKRLQEYANKEKNTGLRNEVLKSFGMSDSMIAAMARNAFNPKTLSKAPMYGDKEIASLDHANIAWSNLGQSIEMAVGHFNAKHGGQLVQDISKMTVEIFRLVDALTVLSEKLKVFEFLGGVAKATATLINLFTQGAVDATGGKPKNTMGNGVLGKEISWRNKIDEQFFDLVRKTKEIGSRPLQDYTGDPFHPNVKTPPKNNTGGEQNVEVNQTLNFQHDGKDHVKTADSVKKAVQSYYRQSAAQGQGS